MNTVESRTVECPNCGEPIEMLIDCSIDDQEYIEDCQVCCRPIMVTINVGNDGTLAIAVRNEDS